VVGSSLVVVLAVLHLGGGHAGWQQQPEVREDQAVALEEKEKRKKNQIWPLPFVCVK